MSPGEIKRLSLVSDLLDLTKPPKEIAAQLATINWDYEGQGVVLTSQHLVGALQRYLSGELSGADIEFWANQIEGREDIRFEKDFQQRIEDVLFELANPFLTELLSHKRAKMLVEKLEA